MTPGPQQDDPEPEGPAAGEPVGLGRPAGDVADWLARGIALLDEGNAAAARQLLAHAVAAESDARSVREAFARAQFDSRDFAGARDTFRWLAEADPADDYARFGLALAASRLGELTTAVEQLSLAVAMRPDRPEYTRALRDAQLAVRRRSGGAPGGPSGSTAEPGGTGGPGGPDDDAVGREA